MANQVWINKRVPVSTLQNQVYRANEELLKLQAMKQDLEGQIVTLESDSMEGVPQQEIIDHVRTFPEVIDIKFLSQGIQLTFVPVVFIRQRAHAKRIFITSVGRFVIMCQGPTVVVANSPSAHPHIGAAQICYGRGVETMYNRLASRNDILGVFETLRRWRMGWNIRDEYVSDWWSTGWEYLLQETDGAWDGDTVQLSPSGKIGSLRQIVPLLADNKRAIRHAFREHRIPPDMFHPQPPVVAELCSCGWPTNMRLCNLCPLNCSICGERPTRCDCTPPLKKDRFIASDSTTTSTTANG